MAKILYSIKENGMTSPVFTDLKEKEKETKKYRFKGKVINITQELADDLEINLAESPILQSKCLEKMLGHSDVMFRHAGVNDSNDIILRVYEIE